MNAWLQLIDLAIFLFRKRCIVRTLPNLYIQTSIKDLFVVYLFDFTFGDVFLFSFVVDISIILHFALNLMWTLFVALNTKIVIDVYISSNVSGHAMQ